MVPEVWAPVRVCFGACKWCLLAICQGGLCSLSTSREESVRAMQWYLSGPTLTPSLTPNIFRRLHLQMLSLWEPGRPLKFEDSFRWRKVRHGQGEKKNHWVFIFVLFCFWKISFHVWLGSPECKPGDIFESQVELFFWVTQAEGTVLSFLPSPSQLVSFFPISLTFEHNLS